MPYNALGDGLKLSLFYTLAATLVHNGVVFIEEPETHMHIGLIELLTHHILNLSTYNIQFFITTHSLEFVERMLEGGQVNIIRMSNCEIVDVLDREDAYVRLTDIGQDLREV